MSIVEYIMIQEGIETNPLLGWSEGLISKYKLNKKCRVQNLFFMRCFLSYTLRNELQLTLSEIGSMFNLSHATIIHSIKRHREMMKYDKAYKIFVEPYQAIVNELISK